MELRYLVDTSVLIEPSAEPLDAVSPLATSVVCLGELHGGVLAARTPDERTARLDVLAIAAALVVLDVDRQVASAYGRIRAASGRGPANDLWIAATAVAMGLTLVTRDRKLAALPGLRSLVV